MELDLILDNVRVPDPDRQTSRPEPTSVGIREGTLVTLRGLDAAPGRRIDGGGNWLLPGFVDLHSHSDGTLLEDPRGISKISQGVTTEVVGNCSMGLAPIPPDRSDVLEGSFSYLGADSGDSFESFGSYRQALAERDLGVNVSTLVGHGCLRLAVMERTDRPAGQEERREMAARLRDAMAVGASGCSLGLMYEPSRRADYRELVSLAEVLFETDGLLTVHLRNEGWKAPEALDELLRVVRETGVRTQISHLKSAGVTNRGTVRKMIDRIEHARDEGYDVAADMYPYTAGSTTLGSLLPKTEGATLDRRMRTCEPDWPGSFGPGALAPDRVQLTEVQHPVGDELNGGTLADLGDRWNRPPWEAARKLVREAGRDPVVRLHILSEEDISTVYDRDWGLVASDGNAVAPDSRHRNNLVHPRYYGTFSRFVRRWYREKQTFTLDDVVEKTAAGPARRLGLSDRGRLEEGARADLVVLDPETVTDRATYEEPHQLSEGIELVVVNGEPVWRDGAETGSPAGKLL